MNANHVRYAFLWLLSLSAVAQTNPITQYLKKADIESVTNEVQVDKVMGYKGELTGLGDKAYWADLGQGIGAYTKLSVTKGKKLLTVTLTDSKPGLTRLEAAKQVANKLLVNL